MIIKMHGRYVKVKEILSLVNKMHGIFCSVFASHFPNKPFTLVHYKYEQTLTFSVSVVTLLCH